LGLQDELSLMETDQHDSRQRHQEKQQELAVLAGNLNQAKVRSQAAQREWQEREKSLEDGDLGAPLHGLSSFPLP
jgi:hypothetical protein